jgi:hypothetical protein
MEISNAQNYDIIIKTMINNFHASSFNQQLQQRVNNGIIPLRHIYVRFDYYQWINTSAGELLFPEGIIRPVVCASALIWFYKSIYFWNVQFLNNVIINETKVQA